MMTWQDRRIEIPKIDTAEKNSQRIVSRNSARKKESFTATHANVIHL